MEADITSDFFSPGRGGYLCTRIEGKIGDVLQIRRKRDKVTALQAHVISKTRKIYELLIKFVGIIV